MTCCMSFLYDFGRMTRQMQDQTRVQNISQPIRSSVIHGWLNEEAAESFINTKSDSKCISGKTEYFILCTDLPKL